MSKATLKALIMALLILCPCVASADKVCQQRRYPHDSKAFTQGLVFHAGKLYESTGEYGRSSLRSVDLKTGKVLKFRALPDEYFGEGLALHNGILYQLTWRNNTVFKYVASTLEPLGSLWVDGEAWGLASVDEKLLMSNGSSVLRFLDPSDFSELGRIRVHDEKGAVNGLNELEVVDGKLFANIYPTNEVVVVDLKTGKVDQRLDMEAFSFAAKTEMRDCLPNGIAYDSEHGCLLVTGKNCRQLWQFPRP